MRPGIFAIATLLAATSLVACVPSNPDTSQGTGEGGKSSGTNPGTGGSSTGGKITGGVATGGNTPTGGKPTGGNPPTGGSKTGGTTGGSSGGSTGGGGAAGGASGGSGGGSSGSCTDTQPPGNTDCATWKSWNNCDQQWFLDGKYCQKTCGKCNGTVTGGTPGGTGGTGGSTGGSTGGTSGGGSSGGGVPSGPGSTNPPMSGSQGTGWASRYWDCCKPSCSWTTAVPACGVDGMSRLSNAKNAKSGCEGGEAFECYDFSPWYDASTNMSYGFVAHNGVNCGTCYMFQFTGEGHDDNNSGAQAIKGQQMIVQTINIGGLGGDQFDLMIPGGGVGDFPSGCTTQWGSAGATEKYGGMLSDCKGDCSCMRGKCSSFFGGKPALKAGCDWFTNWYSCANNPKFQFKQVPCPTQITQKSGVSG